jgi:hypothetical protein
MRNDLEYNFQEYLIPLCRPLVSRSNAQATKDQVDVKPDSPKAVMFKERVISATVSRKNKEKELI